MYFNYRVIMYPVIGWILTSIILSIAKSYLVKTLKVGAAIANVGAVEKENQKDLKNRVYTVKSIIQICNYIQTFIWLSILLILIITNPVVNNTPQDILTRQPSQINSSSSLQKSQKAILKRKKQQMDALNKVDKASELDYNKFLKNN